MASVTFNGQTVTATTLSCANVKPVLTTALNWASWSATSCSADPVAAGTIMTFTFAPNGSTWSGAISAVVDNPSVGANTPFNYTYASGIWALAFTTVVALYLISLKVSLVLNFIRRS
jgi:hypothetical protein